MASLWSLVRGKSSQELWDSAKFSLINDVKITRNEIGRGSFGVVYGAVYGGTQCVAKEIHSNLVGGGVEDNVVLQSFIKEINILSTLRHSNIVYFFGVHFREGSHVPVLIIERMWTSLAKLLVERSSIPLVIKIHILHDVACGLKFLHSQDPPVIHRDLTANNILLNKNMDAKITDLGLATALESITKQRMSTAPGNLTHMPPEALQHNPKYTTKLDIFSFGCVALHTTTQQFPMPTDQFESSQVNEGGFIKVSEYRRRWKYIEKIKDDCTHLTYLISGCIKDEPEYRPDTNRVCEWIEDYQNNPEIKQHCSDSVIDCFQQDKVSLMVSLDQQSTRNKDLESTVALYQSQVQDLTDSTVSKEELISNLQRQNNELQRSVQNQLLENERLRSQNESLQQDLSQRTDNEIIMSLNAMLQQQQQDARERQAENKELRMRLNNLEQDSTRMRREHERREQEGNTQLEALRKKEAELSSNIAVVNNDNERLAHDKEGLERDVQSYCANLQRKEDEIKQLKAQVEELVRSNKSLQNEGVSDKNEKQVDPTNNNKMQKELEELKQKLKHEEEIRMQSGKEMEQKMLKEHQMTTKSLTEVHNSIKEIQAANESRMQKEKQKFHYLKTLKQQEEQFAKLKQEYVSAKSMLKQQLDEKSLRLSLLQPQLSSCQHKLDNKDKELSELLEEKENIQRLLENLSKRHTSAQEELKAYKEAHKREEVDILGKITTENVNEVLQAELLKCQESISEKEKEIVSLSETLQSYLVCHSTDQDKIKKLEKQLKDINKSQTKLQRQYEVKFKQNSKYIETLEKKTFSEYSSLYHYGIVWSPYMSLAVMRIRPCAVIVKDKVFVTGGYGQLHPQGKELKTFLKSLEGLNEVHCLHTGRYQCDRIASPVVLGALANVNGHCVLVSGANSVGNTLTGNVYALCDKGSHNPWKEFSKPLPTPRILSSACCYIDRWLIICGGFNFNRGKESGLLEAVNVVEVLDTTNGDWYSLPEESCPSFSTILCCAVVGEELYVVGNDQVIKTSCNNFIKATTSNNALVWDNVLMETEESDGKLYPFSIVEVNGELMIIASMSDGEDDMTCVLMKGTGGRWRIISKAVECQHCSAAVVTPSLELLLFGGSAKVSVEEATDVCQNGTLIPITDKDDMNSSPYHNTSETEVVLNQPPNISFTGPVHTIQFDHNGGTFQSPIHKVSLVVPPNSLSDDEKVAVYMGATTSGPFDLPEGCKSRSAVLWLSAGSSSVTFKTRLVLPHSALILDPAQCGLMKFLVCEECEGLKYQFKHGQAQFEIGAEYGLIKLDQLSTMMIMIVSESKPTAINGSIDDHVEEDITAAPPVRFLAKLFWPPKCLPVSFKADIFCIQNLPTELYKVDVLYKKSYYQEHGEYPEVMEIEFTMCSNQRLKCILPCSSSDNRCDCFNDWGVTQLTDTVEVSTKEEGSFQYKTAPIKFSFKFNCHRPGARLVCCFELQGAKRGNHSKLEYVPECLKSRFSKLGTFPPILLGSGTNPVQGSIANNGVVHGSIDSVYNGTK